MVLLVVEEGGALRDVVSLWARRLSAVMEPSVLRVSRVLMALASWSNASSPTSASSRPVPALICCLLASAFSSSASRCSRAIFLCRLSTVVNSSSLSEPSSSSPSPPFRLLRVEVWYDFRLPSIRSEKSTSLASTLAGRKCARASSGSRRCRSMPAGKFSSKSL